MTILTPTYNRASFLPRVFSSIAQQVEVGDSIEWLIIDDGSTDDTERVVNSFLVDRPDLVRYMKVANGGKCRALNLAASHSNAEWIWIVDSDDFLLPHAIEEIAEAIEAADESVGMIAGLLKVKGARSRQFLVQPNPCSLTKWASVQGMFDFSPIIRCQLAKQHFYPVSAEEKFMAEGWLYDQISKTHKTYFLNKEVVQAEYLEDGLSAKSVQLRMGSPLNAITVYASQLESDYRKVLKIRAAINFWRFYFHLRFSGRQVPSLDKPPLLWALPALAYFCSDKARRLVQ